MSFFNFFLHYFKRFVFSCLLYQCEPFSQLFGGILVHKLGGVACNKIFESVTLLIAFTVIHPTGGDPVTAHFGGVFERHFYRYDTDALFVVVPIFPMMFVSALMVEPRGAVAFFKAFLFIGRALSAEISGSRDKLGGRQLGKIVGQTLPVQSALEAELTHEAFML